MKATCPNSPDHKEFQVTAALVEEWKIDELGNYVDTIELRKSRVVVEPGNSVFCCECGAEAKVEATLTVSRPYHDEAVRLWRELYLAFPGLIDGEQEVRGTDLTAWLNARGERVGTAAGLRLAVIGLEEKRLERLEGLLELSVRAEGEPDVIDVLSADFGDGVSVDVKVTNGNDGPFVDAVWFVGGCEVQAEAGGDLLGTFGLVRGDKWYVVQVRPAP